MNWRKSSLVLEFSFSEGFEIERQINPEELPESLAQTYYELILQYDNIFIEKVYQLRSKRNYEFYCYREDQMVKFEFTE